MDAASTEPRDFIPYPTNRVVGTVADAASARAALDALLEAGFAREDVEVLRGEDGAHRIDPSGDSHGWLAQLQRTLLRAAAPAEEHKHLMRHVDDLRAGRCVLMVLTKERSTREVAADILNAHGATFIGFYGRWAWQGFTPAPDGADAADQPPAEDHALASTPDRFPSRFAEAWNGRDPGGLAVLFDEDAEFVSAAGLWWHDRAAILSARSGGQAHLVGSTLTVDDVRVKRLAADVAVVHARMAQSSRASEGPADPQPSRSTIYSFVVRRSGAGWLCAAAQNTDIVPAATDGRGHHVRDE